MGVSYQKFLKKNIDLAPLGIERDPDRPTYFCTPRGASLIGWTGVDGVHYSFVRGFGEMVFAVSPMNGPGEYVHPVAENFEDFLRLLLACGGEAALEQSHAWGQKQFDAFLRDNLPSAEQQAVLDSIREKMDLAPMEAPFSYIQGLQARFDCSKIKYTEDFEDPDMNPNASPKAPEWKVYFDGNYWGHHGRDHAGQEIPVGEAFIWGGRRWIVPAIYSCSRGLVVEFCMQIEPQQIRAFMDKWNLNMEDDAHRHFSREQQEEIDRDNPLCFLFSPKLMLNGDELVSSHGCGVSYNPCMLEGMINELEAKWVVDHYGLDASYGWMIWRSAFPWKTRRRPEIRTLSVTMEQQPVSLPGPHFRIAAPGDSVDFVHPATGRAHILSVQEYEQQELPKGCFGHAPDMDFPTHLTAMSYTVTPELPDAAFTVQDCAEGDRPRRKQCDPSGPEAVNDICCIGVIGGASAATVIRFGRAEDQGRLRTACSALHFEPVDSVEWRMTFYEKQVDDLTVKLL